MIFIITYPKFYRIFISLLFLIVVLPSLSSQQQTNLFFFPFGTNITKKIESIDHPQASYVYSYPGLLANLFSQSEAVIVHDFSGLFCKDESSSIIGICNWSIDALRQATEMYGEEPRGYGITGFLEISEYGISNIQVIIFEMRTGQIIDTKKYRPEIQELPIILTIKVAHDIIVSTNLEYQFRNRQLQIHDSILQTTEGFLAYLKLQHEMSLDDVLRRKPDYNKKFDIIFQGFKSQRDFIVLQIMYINILKEITQYEPFLPIIEKIDSLIQCKTDEYNEIYRKIK